MGATSRLSSQDSQLRPPARQLAEPGPKERVHRSVPLTPATPTEGLLHRTHDTQRSSQAKCWGAFVTGVPVAPCLLSG